MRIPRSLFAPATHRALFLSAALPFAFAIHETPAGPVDADAAIAENERFEKRWRLEGSAFALNRVRINAPGLTYVSLDTELADSDAIGAVRVSGDSREIVECVEVVQLPPNGVELRFKSKECANVRGHLLASLRVAKEAHVNELRARGGAVVVVEDGVLLSDCEHASVHVATEGTGNVFVTSARNDINLKRLQLSTLGAGKLQFVSPGRIKNREQLLLEVAGAGEIGLFVGQIDSSFVKTSIAGAGKIGVATREGIAADKIKNSIAGSGKVKYEGHGQCRVHRNSVTGSGSVVARDIQCEEVSVDALGESDVTVQVAERLKVSGWSSTTVRYVGEAPKTIEGKSVSLRPALPVDAPKKEMSPIGAPTQRTAFTEIHAVYDSKLDEIESVSGLGKAVRFLANAFFGTSVEVKVANGDKSAPKKA